MNYTELPEGFRLFKSVDFTEKKLAGAINLVAVAIMVVMFFIGKSIHWHGITEELLPFLLRCLLAFFLIVLYIFCHEGIHGLFIRLLSGTSPYYGFTGMFAYAGCNSFLDKRSYIIIALAPVILLGIALGIVTHLVPHSFFWVIFVVQIQNISGAAGDYYIVWLMLTLPDDVLVKDSGAVMNIYSAVDGADASNS